MDEKIKEQGDKIRILKAEKADKVILADINLRYPQFPRVITIVKKNINFIISN